MDFVHIVAGNNVLVAVSEKFTVEMEISEISETVWIKKADVDLNEIAFDSQQTFLKKYLSS